jgi:hypothetical protein
MRRYGSWLLIVPMAIAMLAATPSRADAVTLKEIIELTQAGVADDVLVALIEIDRQVFPIDSQTLSALKKAGVTDRVMVAIVKSGRTPPPEASAPPPLAVDPHDDPAPEPQVYIIERESPSVREVMVPVPVYVAVDSGVRRSRGRTHTSTSSYDAIRTPFNPFGPLPIANAQRPVPAPKPAEPVYWGWGGKLRPDAWKPTPEPGARHDKQ